MYEENETPGTGSSPREVIARFGEEVLNGKNLDAVDEIASEDFVEHDPSFGQEPGREGLKKTLAELFAAFPDQRWEDEEVIAEGEKVVSRFTFHGTHQGEFMGMPPTGRRVAVKGVVIDRVVDGKWTESRLLMDDLGMMQQLGVIPPMQPPEDGSTAEQTPPRILGPDDGKAVDLGSLGVRFMIWSEESGGGFSLVEHPIPPRTLAAPLHRHANEDEYSYVLEGHMGALLGDAVVYAENGDLVFKPRDQWHTFWNAGDGACRILEIISPGGFEHIFEEMAEDPEAMDGESAAALDSRYGIEVDYESIARLCEEHGLAFPAAEE